MKQESKWIYRVTLTAVFAALVFVSSMISVPIPVAIGDVTRIHLGNIFCLLSGFVLGPVGGGLAAVCGWIAWAKGSRAENHGQNILAAIAGSATYMVLYLGKSFIEGMLLGSALGPVLLSVATKAVTSGVNAVIAVIVSVPLCAAIRLALKKSHLLEKLG